MRTVWRPAVPWLILMGVAIGCTNPPASPGNPAPPQLVQMTVEGPSEVAPGSRADYRAIGLYNDGSTQDVTAAATWSGGTSQGSVVFTLSGASVTGVNVGEAFINVVLAPRNASRTIRVIEPGTFRLSGRVRDGSLGVAGATVRIVSGRGPAAPATANGSGTFALLGVAGEIDIEVSAADYLTQTRRLTVGADTVSDFSLEPSAPRVDLTGTYDMMLTAASSCGWAAPSGVRRYIATISQNGAGFVAVLSGAAFVIKSGFGDRFNGTVTPSTVRFIANSDEGQAWPDVFETLGPAEFLSFEGVGTLVRSGANWSSTWAGLTYIYSTTSPFPRQPTHQCVSSQHSLLLTPR